MNVFEDSYFMNMAPEPAAGIGFCRLVVQLDGERVLRTDPHIGFSHRGVEKLMEGKDSLKGLVYCAALAREAPFSAVYSYVLALEKLLNVRVPPKAMYIRVILAETGRISSHLRSIGNLASDTGTEAVAAIVARECQRIDDLIKTVCAPAVPETYFRAGGVKNNIAPQSAEKITIWLERELPAVLSEIEDLLTENPIFKARTVGVGKISSSQALEAGFSGVNLRASGTAWDLRKKEPYDIYDTLRFEILTRSDGDAYSRYLLRIFEIYQSMAMIREALSAMPEGIVSLFDADSDGRTLTDLSRRFRMYGTGFPLPAGKVYVATESPLGELGVYLQTNGTPVPVRCHFRSAGFPHLQALNILTEGCDLADIRPILSSLNIVMTEVDR